MSEPSSSYQDGEVVWVKWSNSWWPGEVYSVSRVPEDMTSTLRKPVFAFVKFLQEDSFELVRSKNNISKYECDKKMDHIKKGMDKYRSNATMKDNFSACIVKAEQLTGGNVNILSVLDTPTKSKTSSNPSTPVDTAKKSTTLLQTPQQASSSTKKSTVTTPSSYNSSVKVQNTTSAEQNKPNEKRLTCTMCPFTTDRMNLLMMHIKGHSLEIQSRVSSSSSEMRRPIVPKISAARKLEVDDGIADDVRKIKESMKEQTKSSPSPTPVATGRKSRAQATPKPEKVTPKVTKSRAPKRGQKTPKEPSPEIIQPEEEVKPKVYEELKKELLADWSDDDDIAPEKEKIETLKAPIVEEKPKPIEKISEKSSVPIRNIPKKQRVSEIYIQPESTIVTVTSTTTHNDVSLAEEKVPIELSKRSQTSQRKRKLNSSEIPQKEEKVEVDEDEKLLMATAEMLNEIEVPTKSVCVAEIRAQSPSTTFQKSNDIDKRNLPPKERNKRIFRAKNKSPDPVASSNLLEVPKLQIDEPATLETVKIVSVNKNDRQELMLPHKKKQSSRLLQPTVTETIKIQPAIEVVLGGKKKKRKSGSDAVEVEELPAPPIVEILPQSPLRESTVESEELSVDTLTQNRGQKRHLSNENSLVDEQTEQPELKKFHKSHPLELRTITCGANETICITSKGTLTVARRDSVKTTQANSVVVTSQVIISEPIASTEIVTTASKSSSVVSLPQQALKNALKIPKENMEEFKKQGLLTIENNRTKLTPKGLQIFKEYQRDEKTVSNNNVQTSSSTISVLTATSEEPSEVSDESTSQKQEEEEVEEKVENLNQVEEKSSETDLIVSKEEPVDESDSNKEVIDSLTKSNELKVDDKKLESDQNGSELVAKETPMEVDENPKESIDVDENQAELMEVDEDPKENVEQDEELLPEMPNDDDEKKDLESEEVKKDEPKKIESSRNKSVTPEPKDDEPSDDSADMSTKEEDEVKKPLENGSKEIKDDENDDANTSSGAGLIALQAENFGGPANCFYLCRQVDDRYEPVDNQILVLNAQNALVPYEGEVNESALTPAENPLVSENISAYSQLSPNSNIIINTPSGQKVELNTFAIMALQESADENGIASMEYAGEQFELNINAILEAIAAQDNDDVPLIDGIVDGSATNALILTESSELPLEIKHSATQVSETLTKPIMSTTVAPEIATINPVLPTIVEKSLNIDDSLAAIGVTQQSRANVPKSLELPITVTNPTIADTVNHRKLDAATETLLIQTNNRNNGLNE